MEKLRAGHPKKRLLFFVAQDVDDRIRSEVRRLVTALVKSRCWSLAQPRFIHEIRWPGRQSHGNPPVETLGGDLDVYSALPPDLDHRQLGDVAAVVDALVEFARREGLSFEIELGGDPVGRVEKGMPDERLLETFLGEWKRRLGVF